MTIDEARERAAHYRELARRVTDNRTREALAKLVAEYEALAESSGTVSPDRPQRGGTS